MGNIGSLSFTAEPPQLRWADRTGGSTAGPVRRCLAYRKWDPNHLPPAS